MTDGGDRVTERDERAEDALDGIRDPFVTAFVRGAVHVRRHAGFYALGAFMAVTLLVVPAFRDDGDPSPAGLAGTSAPAGGGASTQGKNGAAGTGAGRGAGLAGAAASSPSAGPASPIGDPGAAAAFDGGVEGASGAGLPLPDAPPAPDAPDADVPDFDGDIEPDLPPAPDGCTIAPPAPAPSVDPAREVASVQQEVETLVGLRLPVILADVIRQAADAAGCQGTLEPPVDAPSVPLPVAVPQWLAVFFG